MCETMNCRWEIAKLLRRTLKYTNCNTKVAYHRVHHVSVRGDHRESRGALAGTLHEGKTRPHPVMHMHDENGYLDGFRDAA